jgi:predicted glycosyltransferase
MIYCQDSLGLGHLRRNVNIAHSLSRQCPDASFLFVSDSPVAPFFELPPNSDFLKLPTVVKVSKGEFEVRNLPLLGADRMMDMRARLIRDVALDFQPDVLLVDHMPHGAAGELAACLEALATGRPRCRRILGLRDILGAPEDIVPTWRKFGAYDLLREHYDAVLVYGTRELYDLAAAYDFPADVERKLHYCGYVSVALDGPAPRARLTGKFAARRRHTALVMGGGGSDAHEFMDVVLDAIRWLGDDLTFNTYVVTGPFMPHEARHELADKARGLPVVVRRFRDDAAELLRAADVVVSMAGYNTICEILQYAPRAVVVPRPGPSAEQTIRTRILHERGWLHAIHPSEVTAARLAETISHALEQAPLAPGERDIDLLGAQRAAQHMLELSAAAGARSV